MRHLASQSSLELSSLLAQQTADVLDYRGLPGTSVTLGVIKGNYSRYTTLAFESCSLAEHHAHQQRRFISTDRGCQSLPVRCSQ